MGSQIRLRGVQGTEGRERTKREKGQSNQQGVRDKDRAGHIAR